MLNAQLCCYWKSFVSLFVIIVQAGEPGGAGGVVIASKVDKKLVDLELHSPTQRPTIIVYNLFICGLENC